MINIKQLFLIFSINTAALFSVECPKTITNFYGTFIINEPVLCELIESNAMQRLKNINHYGIRAYLFPERYNRYEHSIGVMVLVRRFGGELDEQIAALLHDASHGTFSHNLDHVFGKRSNGFYQESTNSHQDDIHEWYLEKTDVPEILNRHGFALAEVLHKADTFYRLDQELPTICADRLEYVLFGGYIEHILDEQDISQILNDLHFDTTTHLWYFSCLESANKYAFTSLFLTEHIFGSPMNAATNEIMAAALRRALALELITPKMLYFGIDQAIWDILTHSTDTQVQKYMHGILNYEDSFSLNPENFTIKVIHKCRGVNPWVRLDGATNFAQLSQLNPEFSAEYTRVKNYMAAGYYINCPLLEEAQEPLCTLELTALIA